MTSCSELMMTMMSQMKKTVLKRHIPTKEMTGSSPYKKLYQHVWGGQQIFHLPEEMCEQIVVEICHTKLHADK